MCHTLIKLVLVWTHLYALTSVHGQRINANNESLIFIDSKYFHHDGDEDIRGSDVADEYFQYCDEHYDSGSGYLSQNDSESRSGYPLSGCICCTTTLCLCDSVHNAVHHTNNNTVIVMANSVDLVSIGPVLPYAYTTTMFESLTN